MTTNVEIIEAYDKVEQVRNLFIEYTDGLVYADGTKVDLGFQQFEQELNSLPGKYSLSNNGRLYIAQVDNKIAGCVALREIEIKPSVDECDERISSSSSSKYNIVDYTNKRICEVKRLYVKPEFRGLKIGELLVKKLIQDAFNDNYNYMVLDSLKILVPAIKLYKSLGFIDIDPYYYNPNGDDVSFLLLNLNNK